MSLVKIASHSASASRPWMSHLRSGDSSHTFDAVRVATCSAAASPKSAAHAHPSQSVQLAPSSRCTSSNAVRFSSAIAHLVDELVHVPARDRVLIPHAERTTGVADAWYKRWRAMYQFVQRGAAPSRPRAGCGYSPRRELAHPASLGGTRL